MDESGLLILSATRPPMTLATLFQRSVSESFLLKIFCDAAHALEKSGFIPCVTLI